MAKKFEIEGQPHPDLLDFDNGESRVALNLFDLRVNLGNIVSQDGLAAIENKLKAYRNEVMKELAAGTHLGSSQIEHAISGEISNMRPQELGLQTETEVKLVAAVVLASSKK